jgi:hypothetical protein
MAKPKGGTLTRLFEVSERERQEFYENIQKKIGATTSGIPETGTPEPGTPETGAPDTSTPLLGIPPSGVPASGVPRIPQRIKIRRASQVQDGHSLGEQLVLTTLWNVATAVEGQSYRRITIGYRTLSGMCGLTVNNCKSNLKSLYAKLAIEPETSYSNTMATTYRVFNFAEILRRREAAGLTYVIRSKGAQFVNQETGTPVTGTPRIPNTGTPATQTGIPGSGEKGIPAPGTQLRNKKEADSKEVPAADVGVVSLAIRKYLAIDDDAVRRIVASCLHMRADAAGEEIAYFAEVVIAKHRANPKISNLVGLLIQGAVANYFAAPASELEAFRKAKAEERRRELKIAQEVLDDPQSSEHDRDWATKILAS